METPRKPGRIFPAKTPEAPSGRKTASPATPKQAADTRAIAQKVRKDAGAAPKKPKKPRREYGSLEGKIERMQRWERLIYGGGNKGVNANPTDGRLFDMREQFRLFKNCFNKERYVFNAVQANEVMAEIDKEVEHLREYVFRNIKSEEKNRFKYPIKTPAHITLEVAIGEEVFLECMDLIAEAEDSFYLQIEPANPFGTKGARSL